MSAGLLALSTLLCTAGVGLVYAVHRAPKGLLPVPAAPPPSPGEAPWISVIVPARNEARNIRRCVLALAAQTYPNLEILVVDDRSTDATPQILAQLQRELPGRLRVLRGKPLPRGWAGKPHALAQGAAVARGEWLCFVDADTFAEPHLLASAYAAAVTHGADLLSLLTAQEMGSFWEKVVLPVVFTGLHFGFPAERVNDPRAPDAIANGQFILIRRAVYAAVGGHAAVRDSIVEDKDLAVLVKRRGYRLLLGDGQHLARTRMYTSLRALWEGWTKNIYLGLRDRLGLLAFGGFSALAAAVAPLVWWVLLGLAWRTADPAVWGVAGQWTLLLGYALLVRMRWVRHMGLHPLWGLTLPLGAAVFGAAMLTSAWLVLTRRGVTWKGRRYR